MMTKGKLHSFVIPAYKDSPFLEECILSLLRQTAESDIIITTSTPSAFITNISEKFKVPLIVNNHSKGIAADWSFAYKCANTKFVTLAHQDDIYLSHYTQSCLESVSLYDTDPLIVFTDYYELYGKTLNSMTINMLIKKILLMCFLIKPCIKSVFLKRLSLLFGSTIACPCVTYNKDQIGNFEFSKEFLVCLDWDTWLRLANKQGGFIYIKRKLIQHRLHKDSEASIQTKNYRRKKEDESIFKRLWPKPIAIILANLYHLSSKLIDLRIQ